MITWLKSVILDVGVVRCNDHWDLVCNAFMCLVLRAIEVIVIGHLGHCVGIVDVVLSL